jgi:hypothetical protein
MMTIEHGAAPPRKSHTHDDDATREEEEGMEGNCVCMREQLSGRRGGRNFSAPNHLELREYACCVRDE